MTSLSFPDVNVWVALALTSHTHHESAWQWWAADRSDTIAFSRFTQIGFLRLLTTSAVMGGKPLSMKSSWAVYDQLFKDDRVKLLADPSSVELPFREHSSTTEASPNRWADAYLLAWAQEAGATLITFDQALARRAARCQLLA